MRWVFFFIRLRRKVSCGPPRNCLSEDFATDCPSLSSPSSSPPPPLSCDSSALTFAARRSARRWVTSCARCLARRRSPRRKHTPPVRPCFSGLREVEVVCNSRALKLLFLRYCVSLAKEAYILTHTYAKKRTIHARGGGKRCARTRILKPSEDGHTRTNH